MKCSPVEVSSGLPLNERATEWSRWTSGMKRKPKHNVEAWDSSPPSGPVIASGVIESTYKFLYGKVQETISTIRHDPDTLESYWERDLRQGTSTIFGQILYPANSPASMDIKKKDSRREFLTTVPGLRQFLTELMPQNLDHQEELSIRLRPSQGSGSETILANDLPGLDITVVVDKENRQTSLRSARLITGERQSDLLLPNEAMDLRFITESHLSAGEQMDQRIQDFIAASNLNIWGHDRLKTPASLQLSIPPHATRSGIGKLKSPVDSDSGIPVNYIFASLSHRSLLRVKFLDFHLEYSMIEAGRTGGRRDELRLSLPETMATRHSRTEFASFFKEAFELVSELTSREPYQLQRQGGVVVARRSGRTRPRMASRRRLVRRTSSAMFGARR